MKPVPFTRGQWTETLNSAKHYKSLPSMSFIAVKQWQIRSLWDIDVKTFQEKFKKKNV